MALTKRTVFDQCRIDLATGVISIRSVTVVEEDGVVVAQGALGQQVITPETPGTPEFTRQLARVTNPTDQAAVERIAESVFTPELVERFKTTKVGAAAVLDARAVLPVR